jgi:hypothetical protein
MLVQTSIEEKYLYTKAILVVPLETSVCEYQLGVVTELNKGLGTRFRRTTGLSASHASAVTLPSL